MWPPSLSQNTMICNLYHRGGRTGNGQHKLCGVDVTCHSTLLHAILPCGVEHGLSHHDILFYIMIAIIWFFFVSLTQKFPESYVDGNNGVQPFDYIFLPNSLLPSVTLDWEVALSTMVSIVDKN